MVSARFVTLVGPVFDNSEVLVKAIAKEISDDGGVQSMQQAAATRVAEAAKRKVQAHPAKNASQRKEQAEVADAIKVVAQRHRWVRDSVYVGTDITVYLAISPHPASHRWEFGTSKTPTTSHMRVGFNSA